MAQQQNKEMGSADGRIRREDRSPDEMKYEVAQRGHTTDAHDKSRRNTTPDAPIGKQQTSGYGQREDRENPGKGLPKSNHSHELPGQGTLVGDDEVKDATKTTTARASRPSDNGRSSETRDSRAMSQNGARISDFESR